jgi:twitching motility protein PilT
VAQRALDSIPRVAASCPQLDPWIHQALARGASDLHLHVGCPPKARVYGELVDLATPPVTPEDTLAIVQALLEPSQLEALSERGQVDLAVPLADEVFAQAGQRAPRLRVNVYRQRVGLDFVARLVPAAPPTLSSLGLPLELARLANYPQGLVLITGPMGCGKTNTLAALLDLINEERSEHIITAEDPIEFVHAAKRCVVNQREVGVHSRSYARILRAALREDPDVIALAELRDPESVELALSAAETGHLVLATLHTASAVGTVHRILGSFPPARQEHVRTQLAESLRAVVSQRLARRADGKGRVPVLEILTVTPAVAHLMRDNKLQQIRSQIQTGSSQGMCLLENSASDLVRRGIIDAQEAARFASDGAREVAA